MSDLPFFLSHALHPPVPPPCPAFNILPPPVLQNQQLLQEVAAAVATAAIKFHPKDEGNPLLQQQEDEISPTQLVRQGSLTPGRPDTFADCVLACVKRDRCVLDELCIRNRGVPAFGCFLADMADESGGPDWAELSACTSQIKAAVSDNIYPAFSAQPLYAVLAVLGDWFRGFRDPALSLSALHHLTLVAERLPPLPEDGDSGGGDGGMMAPELVPLTLQKQQHLGLPASANLAVAALQPLQPVDQELLLALAAMARHVRRASGPAGEAPCVQICRQLALLIIGPPLVEHTPQGRMLHTAASRLLWHLLTDDAAYQCLILMKEVRLDGVSKTLKGMGLVLVPAAEAAGTASASDFSRQQLLRSTSAAAAATTPMTSSLPHLAAGPRAGGTSRTAEWLLQGEGGAGGGGAPAAAVALVERTGRHSQPREATLPGMLPTSPDKMAGQQQGSAAIFGFTPVAAAQFSTPQQRVVHNGRDRIMDVLLD